ncbi:unnamed protein product [Blepharisma stoltei]|uniref:Prokaryotic-type class I peptide chain release factors domain-containing protein n=1 Tax=Blepharisma stoltei TaxID=1481888 RepID=A0AAU9K710_9CILI|nr:unnamed protein product [Blepharisma stoltei]
MLRLLYRSFGKFTLNPTDVKETLTRGWGPGGQKVNKSTNCVCLKHIPTGIMVKAHDSRQLYENREIAYKRLEEKIEFQLYGAESKKGIKIEKIKKQKDRQRRRRLQKEENQLKESEESDDNKNIE